MSSDLQGSIGRISALAELALELVDSGSDPRSGDSWWRLAASTLPAQILVLEEAFLQDSVVAVLDDTDPVARTADECLVEIQKELSSWDWDDLDRDLLRAGAGFVLDVAGLLRMS